MNRIAVFPGSFDPITIGHVALLRRAVPLFDRIIVAVGINVAKRYAYPLDERLQRIRQAVAGMPTVDVTTYDTLTTDLCHQVGAQYILRGVRGNADFEYERTIADNNKLIAPDIETVFLIANPDMAVVSSSLVRELKAFGKDVDALLPNNNAQ